MTIMNRNEAQASPDHQSSCIRRRKLGALLSSDQRSSFDSEFNSDRYRHDHSSRRESHVSVSSPRSDHNGTPAYYYSNLNSVNSSPNVAMSSPWSQPSPYTKSPWIHQSAGNEENYDELDGKDFTKLHGLIGSLFREEGHVYSLAACGDLLYTGSDSKNVRVWKGLNDFSGFKSGSGLVKAIVVLGDKIFTGHQDGKIRVWRFLGDKRNTHKRVGNLPTTRDLLRKSINPRNYVQVRRHRNVPWIKHYDAVSCMSIDANQGLLYSGSWDKTLKVWRISDSKCLESIHAHDDAINSVAVGFDGFVFTGSADGTVKAWRRELVGKFTKHVRVATLLKQDHAVTSLAVCHLTGTVYAGSSDGLVSFWEREKHFMSYGGVLRGHKMAVLCLAVGGNLIFSGSADKSICVWRREVGGEHSCIAVLMGHDGPVKCLTVQKDVPEDDDDGDQRWIVYSGSLDKSVKVWRVSGRARSLKELQEV